MGKSTKNTDKLTPDLAYGKKLGTDHVLLMAEQTLTDFGGLPWNHSAALLSYTSLDHIRRDGKPSRLKGCDFREIAGGMQLEFFRGGGIWQNWG